MRHLLNKKDAPIMVNESHSSIPQMQDNQKEYIDRNIKRTDRARTFQHINGKLTKLILHTVDNKILQNLPIM